MPCVTTILLSPNKSKWSTIRPSKIILAGIAGAGTILYEVLLFSSLIKGVGDSIAISSFLTYFFSFIGAIPIAIVFIFLVGGEVKRNNDINTKREYQSE